MRSEYHKINYPDRTSTEWYGYDELNYLPYFHRADGPAWISRNELGVITHQQYWVLDRRISDEDFNTPGFVDAFILEHS